MQWLFDSETIRQSSSVTFSQPSVLSQQDRQMTRSSLLAVAATGLGKTVLMSGIVRHWPIGRVMMISHRYELNTQAIRTFEDMCGEEVDLEQASYFADRRSNPHRIVVASVQTLNSKRKGKYRMERFLPMEFGLLLIDEAHRSSAESYRRVVQYFQRGNPNLKVLGVTATPDRLDGVGLGCVFEETICDLNIQWAVENGWLVEPRQVIVELDELDLRDVKTVGGDLDNRQLAKVVEQEKNLHGMAKPIVDFAGRDKQTIVFASSVAHSQRLAELIRDYYHRTHGSVEADTAVAIDGSMNPQDPRRIEIIRRFKAGEIQFLCNCGVLCLDEETEILTDAGFVGINEMTATHKVANWEQGKIWFDYPKAIVRRDRLPNERMVYLETPRRSIRVTEDHRMLYRTTLNGEFKIDNACNLVGRRVSVPVSGYAEPFEVVTMQEERGISKRQIAANSYSLRKKGMSSSAAKAEAIRRINKRSQLRYKNPTELTEYDCELIGFWLGDGSINHLKKGGVEYTFCQSNKCKSIVTRVDELLEHAAIDSIKRNKINKKTLGEYTVWSMPRGTGFGPQARRGMYAIEPYLKKSGTYLFWGLSEAQFDSLITGLWMADGSHNDNLSPDGLIEISGINNELFSLLQAIAVCRGYRASIKTAKRTKEKHHIPLLTLSLKKELKHMVTKHSLQFELDWKAERVWCVTSHSGNIITRRRGSVTVTGNTEGFDSPDVRLIAIGRPTKSRAMYIQMLGRGTRPLPGTVEDPIDAAARIAAIKSSGKPQCDVLDFVGQSGRHSLVCTTDILAGEEPEAVRERANTISSNREFSGTTLDAIKQAKEQLAAEREARRHRVTVGVKYRAQESNRYTQSTAIAERLVKPGIVSEKQAKFLLKLGFTQAEIESAVTRGHVQRMFIAAEKSPRNSFARWWVEQKKKEKAAI